MRCYLVGFIINFSVKIILSTKIENDIHNYFKGGTVKAYRNTWLKHKKGFENLVETALKESYGAMAGTMNVYINRHKNPHELTPGFLFTDNVVHVLAFNQYLRAIPHLLSPDVSLSLHDNVVRLETPLTRIFVDNHYVLFRNRSDLEYNGLQHPYKQSPFALQQVHSLGRLTIVGEDCHLVGQAVVTMTGLYLHISHTSFKLVNCKFTIEIIKSGLSSPPVVAPYFSKEQSAQLEEILSKSLDEEMWPKLQGAMISLVNTTAIFGDKMFIFRRFQKNIFSRTADFMQSVVRHLKKVTIKRNQGTVTLNDFYLSWDESLHDDTTDQASLSLTKVTMNNLDLVYSSHRGGPIHFSGLKIAEEIRFGRLQIRGTLHFENSTSKGEYEFVTEVLDVGVDVIISLEKENSGEKQNSEKVCYNKGEDPNSAKPVLRERSVHEFNVLGWRSMENIIVDRSVFLNKRVPAHSFIAGYLTNEIPKAIKDHLLDVFEEAVDRAEDEDDGYLAMSNEDDNDDDVGDVKLLNTDKGNNGQVGNEYGNPEENIRRVMFVNKDGRRRVHKYCKN